MLYNSIIAYADKLWTFAKNNKKIVIVILMLLLSFYLFNKYRDWSLERENSKLNDKIKQSEIRLNNLQILVNDSLNELRDAKIELAKETANRKIAENILKESEIKTNEKLQNYENAKRNVIIDNNDYTTKQLCDRARELEIICKE